MGRVGAGAIIAPMQDFQTTLITVRACVSEFISELTQNRDLMKLTTTYTSWAITPPLCTLQCPSINPSSKVKVSFIGRHAA